MNTPTGTICQEFCSNNGVNCDAIYKNYCQNLGQTGAMNDENCGCFMDVFNPNYYANFFTSLEKQVNFTSSVPDYPGCFYPRCATSNIKNFTSKQQTCPDVQQCLIVDNINNDGTIAGNVGIQPTANCTFIEPANLCANVNCSAGSTCNSTTGSCTVTPVTNLCANVNCPSGSTCDSTTGSCVGINKCAEEICPFGSTCDSTTGDCIIPPIHSGAICNSTNCPSGSTCNSTTGNCVVNSSSNIGLYVGIGVGALIAILLLLFNFLPKRNKVLPQ